MLFVVWLEAVSVLWDGFKRSNQPFHLAIILSLVAALFVISS
jgi:hypothetical protein